jgi:thymidylate synthase
MNQYLDAVRQVLEQGETRTDRTGTGTISVFGLQQRYDLAQGFPAVTTKRLAWRSVVSELLWFIEGSGDEYRLREILYGDRDSKQDTIWTANAEAPYWHDRARYQGDLGRIYGVQWRHWRTPIEHEQETFRDEFGNYYDRGGRLHIKETDQLQDLIANIKRDPYSRRHILTAWNPGELDQMALPPCHVMAQFYVSQDNKLSCQMYQRSCDMFLGVPFNIASYSLLTALIAQVCNLDVGEFVHVLGDAHIYLNHVEQVKEQLTREPLPAPQLWLNPDVQDIDGFTMADIRLDGYRSHAAIIAEMAV